MVPLIAANPSLRNAKPWRRRNERRMASQLCIAQA